MRRSPNPADARSSRVSATAMGVRATNAAVRKVEAVAAGFFAALADVPSLARSLRSLLSSAESAKSAQACATT